MGRWVLRESFKRYAFGETHIEGQGLSEIHSCRTREMNQCLPQNIVQVQLTDEKLYALSASGKVYTLATSAEKQTLSPGAPTPASDSWWGTGWLWGEDETVSFAEVTATEKLAWGESYVNSSC